MSLFLVQATVQTTHSPGDDGMRRDPPTSVIRLVDADDDVLAARKFRAHYERYEPYEVRVEVSDIEVTGVLR